MTPETPSRGTLGRDTDNRCWVTVTDRGSGVCCSYLLILTGISTIYYYIHYVPRYLFVFRTSAPLIAHFLLQMQSSIVSGVKWMIDVTVTQLSRSKFDNAFQIGIKTKVKIDIDLHI